MIKKMYGALAFSLLVGLASCNDDNPWMDLESGHGAIKLSLNTDGSVKDAIPQTRADGLFKIPEASDFKIHLLKSDGSHDKHYWHDEFIAEKSFPTGTYTLRAYAGEEGLEGFDCPYFEGSTQINVLEARETEAHVHAKVVNSLISVTYGENFKKYMKEYSAGVHSAGGSYIPYESDETRPAFVNPGEVSLSVSFTNQQNQSVTLQPAEFMAEGGHHYHVSFDVNGGEVGDASLVISFDDDIEAEDVWIDLTDELFTAPAPSVKLLGITAEEGITPELEFLSGEAPEDQYRFNVISHGGLKAVNLTLKGYDADPDFAGDIELISTSEAMQAKLSALGIDCKGLFRNPDKMAIIDFSNLPKNLPAGEYELSVVAKDMLTRTSDPVTVKITSVAPKVEVTPQSAIYGLNQGTLLINYNGSKPTEALSFEAMDVYGKYVKAEIVSGVESQKTRAIEGKNYLFTIKLPDTGDRTTEPVRVYLYGQLVAQVELDIEMPVYTVKADGFAKRVMLKVEGDEDQIAAITGNLKIYDGNTPVAAGRISRDIEFGLITVTGLTSNTHYTFNVTLLTLQNGAKEVQFDTESEQVLENGDFSKTEETIHETINSGGRYKCGSSTSNWVLNTADVIASVPLRSTGWATINEHTYYSGADPKNTWFMVPSTYMENGAVNIRSVAYSHKGTLPPDVNQGFFSSSYYNGNAPESFQYRRAGELFLGSYSFNGTENRVDGISFTSRPSSVTFTYSYVPFNDNDKGEAYIAVLNSKGEVIVSDKVLLDATSTLVEKTVALAGYKFGDKAVKLEVRFRSSYNTVETSLPTGSQLAENRDADNSVANAHVSPPAGGSFHVPNNLYKAKSTGSVLTISNVKLNY